MSYILEALRKAEAERRRGTVPDLHAQMLPAGAPSGTVTAPARSSVWGWLAGAALLTMAAGAAWVWLGRSQAPAVAVLPPGGAPAMAAAPLQAEAASVPAAPAPSAPAAAPAPAADKAPARKSPPAKRKVAVKAPARPKPPAPAKTDNAPQVQAPAAPARVPALAELPGELRQQVPALAIGGSVYSPQPSARMVVVNGQVFQEGNTLTPDLKLEQIRQKSAVFSIRGTRFEVPL